MLKLKHKAQSTKDTNLLIQALGWIGVVSLLCGYALVSFGYLQTQSAWFHVLNLVGAVGLLIETSYVRNWQPVVVNSIYGALAIYAIIRILA